MRFQLPVKLFPTRLLRLDSLPGPLEQTPWERGRFDTNRLANENGILFGFWAAPVTAIVAYLGSLIFPQGSGLLVRLLIVAAFAVLGYLFSVGVVVAGCSLRAFPQLLDEARKDAALHRGNLERQRQLVDAHSRISMGLGRLRDLRADLRQGDRTAAGYRKTFLDVIDELDGAFRAIGLGFERWEDEYPLDTLEQIADRLTARCNWLAEQLKLHNSPWAELPSYPYRIRNEQERPLHG